MESGGITVLILNLVIIWKGKQKQLSPCNNWATEM
jgi:hypothetical protein